MRAEEIATALGARQSGPDRWMCSCVSHDDESPSLSIRQFGKKVLFHCFAGCSQADVLDNLRQRGLWKPESRLPAATVKRVSKGDIDYMASFILIYCAECDRMIIPLPKDTEKFRSFLRRLRDEGLI